MTPRSFLRAWAVVSLGLAIALASLTVLVDPYGIFGTVRVEGWTANKPAAPLWPRLAKPYLLRATNPATIVLGSSTVDLGIDPESTAWPASDRPVFNLGIQQAKPSTQLRYLRDGLAVAEPRLVVIGASFDDAMIFPDRAGVRAGEDMLSRFDARLRFDDHGAVNSRHWLGQLENLAFAVFSLRAVRDSLQTIVSQRDPMANVLTPLGYDTGGPFVRWIAAEGQRAFFLDKDAYKASDLVKWRRQPRLATQPVLEAIRLARRDGAKVIVFLLPSHADDMELLRQAGLTSFYNTWKENLVAGIEQLYPGGEPVPVWDFGGFSPYTTEAVPEEHDTTHQMHWYWDLVHFRPELGTMMLNRMLNHNGPDDFGVPITSALLSTRASAYAAAQHDWIASHPADVDRLAGVLARATEAVCRATPGACPRSQGPGPGR